MLVSGSQCQSLCPASRTRTLLVGSADRRLASAEPAEPPPTMTKSYVDVSFSLVVISAHAGSGEPGLDLVGVGVDPLLGCIVGGHLAVSYTHLRAHETVLDLV